MKRRGGLMLEAAIAAALVAVAMVAVAQLLAVSAMQERALEQRRVATQEAANALESILIRRWADLTSEQFAGMKLPEAALVRLSDGEIHCAVELLDEQPPAKKIVADVSWRNQSGDRERVQLCTWKFKTEDVP